MEKFVVGFDADGVLTDMTKFKIENGREYFKKEPINPNAYESSEMFGVSKFRDILFGLKYLDKYCKDEPPRDFVVEVMKKLNADEEIESHEITARKFTTSNSKFGKKYRDFFENWLKKYELNFKSIQYCSESDSPRDKFIACNKLDVDVMVEDKPEVALYLAEQGVKVLLMDAPYNKETIHPNIKRVYNWNEVYDNIQILKNQKLHGQSSNDKNEEFEKINTAERIKMPVDEQVNYLKEYKNHLKSIAINKEAIEKAEHNFKLYYKKYIGIAKIAFRPIVIGKENIPYQNGVIFASNHLNSLDQFLIQCALGKRSLTGLAASTIKDTERGKIFQDVGAIFVDRNDPNSRSESEDQLGARLVNDKDIIIFPEGTRKNKDKEGKKQIQLKFKYGTVALAQATGSSIVPISIKYGPFCLVRIGKPITVKKEDNFLEKHELLENTILDMTLDGKRR